MATSTEIQEEFAPDPAGEYKYLRRTAYESIQNNPHLNIEIDTCYGKYRVRINDKSAPGRTWLTADQAWHLIVGAGMGRTS